MVCLIGLPVELLLPILDILCALDLRSLLRCQATCSLFHLLISKYLGGKGPTQFIFRGSKFHDRQPGASWLHELNQRVYPELLDHFALLLQCTRHPTMSESSDGHQLHLPFRLLDWAKDETRRRAFLRPEASWRRIGVTFGCTATRITHVDIVKSFRSHQWSENGQLDRRSHSQYLQLELPSSDVSDSDSSASSSSSESDLLLPRDHLTFGLLYNLNVTSGGIGDIQSATHNFGKQGWEIYFGKRLRSYDWIINHPFHLGLDEHEEIMEHEASSVVLNVMGEATLSAFGYVGKPWTDMISKEEEEHENGLGWTPKVIGEGPKLRAWQGPEPLGGPREVLRGMVADGIIL